MNDSLKDKVANVPTVACMNPSERGRGWLGQGLDHVQVYVLPARTLY